MIPQVMEAHGDPFLSPWVCEFPDYLGRVVRITTNFNDATRAITNAVIHRDTGCRWTKVVFDDPGDAVKAKRLAAPNDGQGDRTYTGAQIAAQGLSTIDQAMALQITAEP
jgi:hypothetical protein